MGLLRYKRQKKMGKHCIGCRWLIHVFLCRVGHSFRGHTINSTLFLRSSSVMHFIKSFVIRETQQATTVLSSIWSFSVVEELPRLEDSSSMTCSLKTWRSGFEKHQPLVLRLPIFQKRGVNQSRFLHCPLFCPGESYSGVMKSAYTCGQ